jgi:predicted site-specific integrase-resolvase
MYLGGRGLVQMDSGRVDAVYARVSTHKQNERGDLTRQVEAVMAYAAAQNPVNIEVLRVFVNYKDRLTRFGFRYIEEVCKAMGTEIIVVSNETQIKTVQEELAEDLCAIIHSFRGKLYGMRGKVGKRINNKVNALYKGEAANEN